MCVLFGTAYFCLHILHMFCVVYAVICRSNYKGSGGKLHFFLTPELYGGECSNLRPRCFNVGKLPVQFLNMGLSGLLRWFGRFGKRKVTWLWRNSNHASSSQAAILITPFHELHDTRFSNSTDMHPVDHSITRLCTFLQFVTIVIKYFLHDPTLCHHCHKILSARPYTLSPLS